MSVSHEARAQEGASPSPTRASHEARAREGASQALTQLLGACIAEGASDLHLSAGEAPRLRIQGALRPVPDLAALGVADLVALTDGLLSSAQEAAYERDGALDLALEHAGARFRVNVFRERGARALAIRRLDDRIQSFEELALPPDLTRLADLQDGLILVTGPTGSGKTTTLATILDQINRERPCHLLTLEDPIEYVHPSKQALVRQRQLHADFPSFAQALRSALREDPDVVLLGEMRDLETMRAALMAAETGHLVFSTLHAGNAVGAVERLVGAFPSAERDPVRHQLALVLRAALAQRLLPTRDGKRAPAVEVMWVTTAVANLIRTGKSAQLYAALESQSAAGMRTLEQSLAEGVAQGRFDEELARRTAREPELFDERLRHTRRPTAAGQAPRTVSWR